MMRKHQTNPNKGTLQNNSSVLFKSSKLMKDRKAEERIDWRRQGGGGSDETPCEILDQRKNISGEAGKFGMV